MNKNVLVAVVVLMVGACSPAPDGPTGGGGGSSTTGGSTGTGGSGAGSAGNGGGSQAGGGTGAGNQGGGAGGGTSASRSDELTAGTRLKVRAVVGVDGSRQQLGFFDTMRMENCSFYASTDGTRCLPVEGAAYGGIYFADTQCSQPLFTVTTGCAAPKYGYRATVSCGVVVYEFHSMSPEINPPPTQVFTGSGTTCSMTSPPTGMAFYRSAGVLPPSAFVQGSFVIEP